MHLQNRELLQELFGDNNWLYHHTPDWMAAMVGKIRWLSCANQRRQRLGLPPRQPGPDVVEFLELAKGKRLFIEVANDTEWIRCEDCAQESRVKHSTLERRKRSAAPNICKICRNIRRRKTMKGKSNVKCKHG